MSIIVAGLVTIETSASVDAFPVEYSPAEYRFNGITSSVSGVGFNIAKALATLGSRPRLVSIIGNDIYRDIVSGELAANNIEGKYVLPLLAETCQSVILYDKEKRKILLDLKNIQETAYPAESFRPLAGEKPGIAVCCNINYARAFLKPFKEAGKTIATDVHALSSLDDEYNRDFMAYADILFLSNANFTGREEHVLGELAGRFSPRIIVMGCGGDGSKMYVRDDGKITNAPAVYTRPVVNTIGAGDALFSSFLHFYGKSGDPYAAIKRAAIFASYKVGESGGARGFLTEADVLRLETEGQ
jgi:ribokinase